YFETAAGEAPPSNDERNAMKKLAHRLTLAIVCAGFLTGCTMGHAPVVSLVTLEEKGPVAVGPAAGSSKIGRSEAWGILVSATGDASISAAMRNGGITRIHHVDHETSSFLGVYAKYTTIVYGEETPAPPPLISTSAPAAPRPPARRPARPGTPPPRGAGPPPGAGGRKAS